MIDDTRRVKLNMIGKCFMIYSDAFKDGKPECFIFGQDFTLIKGNNQKILPEPEKEQSALSWLAFEVSKIMNDRCHKLFFSHDFVFITWMSDYYSEILSNIYFSDFNFTWWAQVDLINDGNVNELLKHAYLSWEQSGKSSKDDAF